MLANRELGGLGEDALDGAERLLERHGSPWRMATRVDGALLIHAPLQDGSISRRTLDKSHRGLSWGVCQLGSGTDVPLVTPNEQKNPTMLRLFEEQASDGTAGGGPSAEMRRFSAGIRVVTALLCTIMLLARDSQVGPWQRDLRHRARSPEAARRGPARFPRCDLRVVLGRDRVQIAGRLARMSCQPAATATAGTATAGTVIAG